MSVRDYRARRDKAAAKAVARDRLAAVAVDGKTARRARRADGLVISKNAHYIAIVKKNQPLPYAQLTALPWRHVPTGAWSRRGRPPGMLMPSGKGRPAGGT